ncbi:M23 family metallopeptidase [Methanofollis formosanus]|uniref:M23 family metallopeptidase n=1 Tax=Methanofollis formosanus TaxID=299308 RepID=A0A8G1A0I7_9EURY|nr:M23 family metallopeptidase [Methanofollis formosanus]QYZ78937.1 M23 family metallopeptidase [Methanofollis formosanus]
MSKIRQVFILFIMTAAIVAAGCTQSTAELQASAIPPVNLTVPFSPIPVPSSEGVNLAYELELSPTGNETPVPERVEVVDPATGESLWSLEGDMLAALYHPVADPPPTAAELENGTGKVPVPRVSLWFKVSPDAVPDRLVHRLTLNQTGSGLSPVTLDGGEVAVRTDLRPVVIGSPMRGAGWTAIESTAPMTHHFLAQITMNGVTRVPQRYAQDWIYLDPETGEAVVGNATLAKNYLGYGREIYSVANGTVVDVLDGLPDLETIYSAPPATVETAAGNYVIVDIGDEKYACYAHMAPGSVRVEEGDTVAEGQVLGQVGNSGNSDIPHLHFQVVTDTPSFLGAEGYPHVYRSFDVIGGINQTLAEQKTSEPDYSMNRFWSELGDFVVFSPQSMSRENELPENFAIVLLP